MCVGAFMCVCVCRIILENVQPRSTRIETSKRMMRVRLAVESAGGFANRYFPPWQCTTSRMARYKQDKCGGLDEEMVFERFARKQMK